MRPVDDGRPRPLIKLGQRPQIVPKKLERVHGRSRQRFGHLHQVHHVRLDPISSSLDFRLNRRHFISIKLIPGVRRADVYHRHGARRLFLPVLPSRPSRSLPPRARPRPRAPARAPPPRIDRSRDVTACTSPTGSFARLSLSPSLARSLARPSAVSPTIDHRMHARRLAPPRARLCRRSTPKHTHTPHRARGRTRACVPSLSTLNPTPSRPHDGARMQCNEDVDA